MFRAFAAKVFTTEENVGTLEKCRWKLENLFEEKFKPERDFMDYLLLKKERHYETCDKPNKEVQQREQVRSSLADD